MVIRLLAYVEVPWGQSWQCFSAHMEAPGSGNPSPEGCVVCLQRCKTPRTATRATEWIYLSFPVLLQCLGPWIRGRCRFITCRSSF